MHMSRTTVKVSLETTPGANPWLWKEVIGGMLFCALESCWKMPWAANQYMTDGLKKAGHTLKTSSMTKYSSEGQIQERKSTLKSPSGKNRDIEMMFKNALGCK